MKLSIISIIGLSLLVSGCSPDVSEFKSAANIAASVWGAKGEFTGVKHVDKADGEHGHHLGILFSEFTKAPDQYSDETLSSVLALAFMQNIGALYLSDYEGTEIEIIRGGRQSRYIYAFKDLKDVGDLSAMVADFLAAPYNNGLDELKKFTKSEVYPDSVLQLYRNEQMFADTNNGKVLMNMIGGFRYAEMGEGSEPLVLFLASQQREKISMDYTIVVSRKDAKIIAVQAGIDTFR